VPAAVTRRKKTPPHRECAAGRRKFQDEEKARSNVNSGRMRLFSVLDEPLPKHGNLMRRSWHSIPCELRGRWLLLDTTRSDD
jgi:hypothetical protein